MKIFADTSAWIALLVPKDRHHSKAQRIFQNVLGRHTLVVTSNYIIDETVTWLRYRDSHTSAVDFRNIIMEACDANRLHLEWITQSIEGKAWGLFVERADLGLSLTDCTSAVICADLKLDIWTYDSDFTALGITALSDIDL
jgi:predicted nucleic acid-binding protein